MLEDHRLLRRLRRGDTEALRRIYEKYLNDLLAVAVSLLTDVHAAEDCLHDVFVKFARAARDGVCVRTNLKGYLISCVANRARDELRMKTRRSSCRLQGSEYPANSSEPASWLIDREESLRVFKAMAKLPYEQREVFVLHVQGGMKFHDIAVLLGLPTGTVQSRYRYGIEKLRILLTEE